jgi:hypothetical protein
VFDRGDTLYDPWHYVPVLARKPGALRNGALFKDWVLPASMERVRRKLAGADDGNRQMVDILTAVLTDGLPAVEAACAEAVAQGVHSADVVINILARQRDPGPPATILTPAALTLRHAPIADCARYDNLRRTTRICVLRNALQGKETAATDNIDLNLVVTAPAHQTTMGVKNLVSSSFMAFLSNPRGSPHFETRAPACVCTSCLPCDQSNAIE